MVAEDEGIENSKRENNVSRCRHTLGRHDERRRDRMARDGASPVLCTEGARPGARGKTVLANLAIGDLHADALRDT